MLILGFAFLSSVYPFNTLGSAFCCPECTVISSLYNFFHIFIFCRFIPFCTSVLTSRLSKGRRGKQVFVIVFSFPFQVFFFLFFKKKEWKSFHSQILLYVSLKRRGIFLHNLSIITPFYQINGNFLISYNAFLLFVCWNQHSNEVHTSQLISSWVLFFLRVQFIRNRNDISL